MEKKPTTTAHLRDLRKPQPVAHQKPTVGRSAVDFEGRCRKHPEHRQSRGVCPFCLRDRLSQLSASSSAATTLANSSAGGSPTLSNSNLSSAATSPRRLAPHNTSRVLKPGEGELKKSRSMAFAIVRPSKEKNKSKKAAGGEPKEKEKRKKTGGFWSKLVVGSSERRREAEDEGGGSLRSRTMKENASAKWTLF